QRPFVFGALMQAGDRAARSFGRLDPAATCAAKAQRDAGLEQAVGRRVVVAADQRRGSGASGKQWRDGGVMPHFGEQAWLARELEFDLLRRVRGWIHARLGGGSALSAV